MNTYMYNTYVTMHMHTISEHQLDWVIHLFLYLNQIKCAGAGIPQKKEKGAVIKNTTEDAEGQGETSKLDFFH